MAKKSSNARKRPHQTSAKTNAALSVKKTSNKVPKKTLKRSSKSSQIKGMQKMTTRTAAALKSRPVTKGQWVYTFGDGKAEGKSKMRDLLGGKGANLAEMANLGLPVPPGFTITTEVCTYFMLTARPTPKS